jgi:hypothetical protein
MATFVWTAAMDTELTALMMYSPKITIVRYLMKAVAAGVVCFLGNDAMGSSSWVSIGSIGIGSWGSSVGSISIGSWGSGIGNSWGSNSDLADSVDWGVDSLADGLDRVSSGLMDNGLADGLVGPDGSMDLLGAEGGDVLEDWLGDMGGLDDRGGLVGGNWGGNVGVDGLSHGVGQGGDLGGDLGKGMGLSSRVGKVAAQSVVLNAGTVMSGGSDQVRSSSQGGGSNSGGNSHGGGSAEGDQGGEEEEGVHGGCC